MIQFHGMKVYYIAYRYQDGLEYVSGPYGAFWEALAKRNELIGTNIDDEQLVVVTEHKEVMIT